MLISARDQSGYQTNVLGAIQVKKPRHYHLIVMLVSLNAHGIASITSGSFPGSCTLDKITQEIFYILYIARYHVKIMRCWLDYARRAPECFCLQILLWERKKEWSALKQGDCHFIVCSVSSVCILISTSNKYRNFSYLDICRYLCFVRTTPALRFVFIISSS